MATIIKDGFVIQVDLDSVRVSKSRHPDCTVVSAKATCGQSWDGSEFFDPVVIPDDSADAKREIADTDRRMARFAEDLYDTLVAKKVISPSDFDQATQDLMSDRKSMRDRI